MLTDLPNLVVLHRWWLLGFVVATCGAGGWYYTVARSALRWPGGSSAIGLVLGTLAAAMIFFEFALWLRKTRFFRTRRILGNAQLWMKAHIWLGLLVLPLAVMHSGFAFGGILTSVLMSVLLIVIASGIFGQVMQNVVPRWMLEHVPNETVFSQIDLVKRQYADEAARIMSLAGNPSTDLSPPDDLAGAAPDHSAAARVVGARRRVGAMVARTAEGTSQPRLNSKPLWQAYAEVLQPHLERTRPFSGPLSSRRRSHDYFAALRAGAGEDAAETVNALEALCDQSRDLDVQRRLHYLLHGWLAIHLPLSISLVILLVVHVIYALRFG